VAVNAQDQRQELAAFLRSRRERRRPEEAGLPAGPRRRTPGLRREEVATLAGLSVTWYTWLEQGRGIRASRQVLASLVNVLGLDGVETAHLFQLAGEAPPSGASGDDEVPAQYRLLLDQLDPNPAYIVNRRFDIVAWNRGCAALFEDLQRLPPERRNVLWLTFTSPAARTMSDDWERDAVHTVGLFRAQLGQDVSAADVAELVGRLEQESEDFRRIWRRRELTAFAPADRAVHHPKLGRVEFEYVKMHAANDDKTLVALLAPRDSELFRRLAELTSASPG
jgi:transcriptional regulator with XRE-family HTH domain